MRAQLLLLLGLAIVPGACGAPAGVSRAVATFSQSTVTVESALKDIDSGVAERQTARNRREALKGEGAVVRRAEKSCTTDSKDCRLELTYKDPTKRRPIVIDHVISQHLKVAHELRQYGEGLAAILAADETAKVKAGFDKAITGVCGLAGVVGAPSPACSALGTPVVEFLGFLYGEYQEQLKLNAIRKAVTTMDPVVTKAAQIFGAASSIGNRENIAVLRGSLDTAFAAWEGHRTEANLDRLLDAANKLDTALAIDPRAVFDQFGKAHNALLDLLTDHKLSLADIVRQIEDLYEKAQALASIAREFKKAAASEKAK